MSKKQAKMQAKKRTSHTGPSQKVINMATELRKSASRYPQEQKQNQSKAFLRRIQNR